MIPKVLIIEDDPSNLKILEVALEKMACELFTAINGEQGLEMAQNHQPQLILMDIMMPKMNGLEILKNLRQSSNLAHTPVLVISAKTAKKDAEMALEAGATEFISKPFRVKEIQEKVKKYLGKKSN